MKKLNLSKKAKIVIASVAGAIVVAGGVVGTIFGVKAAKAKKTEEETATDAE
jgi:hypothetical protein